MYRAPVLLAFAAIIMSRSLGAQSDSALAWVREAPHRAEKLAGCFRLTNAIRDSVTVPPVFHLSATAVRALGYHRIASFWTDLPRLESAETRPIWTPVTD